MTDRPSVRDVKDTGDATQVIAEHFAETLAPLGTIRRATIVLDDADPDTPEVRLGLAIDGDYVKALMRQPVVPLDEFQTPHHGRRHHT